MQAHLKAALANATPKLLKELAKTSFVDLEEKIWSHPDNFKITSYNSDGELPLPARTTSSPLPESMRESLIAIYQITTTRTVPSTGTKSMGLAADARGVMVFAIPSGQ